MSYYKDASADMQIPQFTKKDKRRAVKTFSRVHGSLVGYTLLTVAAAYIIQIITMMIVGSDGLVAIAENPYYFWGMQVASMYVIAFPLFWLMIRKLPVADRRSDKMSLMEFGAIFLVSEAIMLLGSMFSQWLTGLMEVFLGHEIPDTTSDIILSSPLWIIILVAVIIGPIVEEMIFRKAMIDRLSVYGDRLAVIVSAFAFGLFHGNFYQLFYATALGLVLGYVYTRTRRSIYNCLLHIVVNFMGTVPAMLLQDSLDRINALPEDALIEGEIVLDMLILSAYSSLQYALAIAGIIVFIIATVNRTYTVSDECDIRIPSKNLPRVLVFNLGTLLFIIFCLIQCLTSLLPA